jgi:hypothetical protein
VASTRSDRVGATINPSHEALRMVDTPNLSGRPSTAYVRAYLKYEAHCLLAEHVPPWVYAAIRERFDALIDEKLARPPVMAYDNVRPPLRQLMGELLAASGYPLTKAAEAAIVDAINVRLGRQNVALYERDRIAGLAKEIREKLTHAELITLKPAAIARRLDFTINGGWYSRATDRDYGRVNRRDFGRAVVLARSGQTLV